MTNFAKDKLRSFIERVERLEEQKAAIAADIREIYSQAKGHGYSTKIMRKVVARRKLDAAKREEEDTLMALYQSALEAPPPSRAAPVVQLREAAE